MSKMKELSMVLDELVTCGEALISTANALKEIFSEPAADTGPENKTAKSTSPAKGKAAKATSGAAEGTESPNGNALPNPEAATPESVQSDPQAAAPKQKTYTKEEVRGILAAKSGAGHSDEVRALLSKFGAKQLKQVDPKDYSALVEEAASIGETASAEKKEDANE